MFPFLTCLMLAGAGADPPPAPAGVPWKAWLERKVLPAGEAKSAMADFVARQLRPLPAPDTAEAWRAGRDALRRQVLAVLGIDDLVPPRWDLNVRAKGTLRREGYRIEKITFESWPGMAVPALLYLPEGISGRVPGMVSIAGHSYATGKASDYLQRRNVNLALRGCAVLSYDYIDTGERNTGPDAAGGKPYGGGNDHGIRSFSFSRRNPTGLEVLDGIRALDVLAARPEVDPDRLGFTGESGGSNSTYWVAAVDDRVVLAAPVSSASTFDYWIRLDRNWDWHQRPTGIRRIADIGVLLALHAPRPLLVISSLRRTDDEEFPVEEAEKSVAWARTVYRLLDAGDAIESVESSTGHGYQEDKRRHLYRWVERSLRPPRARGDGELPVQVESKDDLRCGLPAGNRTFGDIYEEWLRPLPRGPAAPGPAGEAELRRFLGDRLGLPDPLPPVKAEEAGREEKDGAAAEFLIVEPEPGIRLPGVLLAGRGAGAGTRIVLVPGRDPEAAGRALGAGCRAFAFDPRGTGEVADGGGPARNWAWFAGRPGPGLWALDILQAARLCRERYPGAVVTIEATNRFGWPALLAAAAVPGAFASGSVTVPVASLRDILRAQGDAALADVPGLFERLDVPGIRRLAPDLPVRVESEPATGGPAAGPRTRIAIADGRWRLDGAVTYPGAPAEGLLMNLRAVNAVFEDRGRTDFDPESNTDRFAARIPEYVAGGVRAFTINLQGGMPGYEGAANSAFEPDGSLRAEYLSRVRRAIERCDRSGAAVILGCFYQRQDQRLRDADAVRAAVAAAARWIAEERFGNVVLEIANEFGHGGFDHDLLKTSAGQVELMRIARRAAAGGPGAPRLLVSASGLGDGRIPDDVAAEADFLLIHFNGTPVDAIPARIAALRKFGKPIVCNEDDKLGEEGARAAAAAVAAGASWGFMAEKVNQRFPFTFAGVADDPIVYARLRELTSPRAAAGEAGRDYFPPPESRGGWRTLDRPDDIRRVAGMDPDKLAALRKWLLDSDDRGFAAVVIRRGWIALQVERGNSAVADSRRVASVSKAVCATVLAIASERSRQGLTPRRMTFDDPAFGFIPWARPLSDPRKARITVKQLLNHTSGICPEATGAPNDGDWAYILGHSGDLRTEKLAFDPGTACGYSTHALDHAALVCETVTGEPYDEFAIEALFKPLGIERWWFQYFEGGEKYGRHPSHGLGMPARDLARIAYCMLRGGRWGDRQVIPRWFVDETGSPTHDVRGPEMRFKIEAQNFSHGWQLPALLAPGGERGGQDIPRDARYKPGSGGQLIAFVPSLDLVVTRQTGSSGEWGFEEYLRRACAAVAAPAAK